MGLYLQEGLGEAAQGFLTPTGRGLGCLQTFFFPLSSWVKRSFIASTDTLSRNCKSPDSLSVSLSQQDLTASPGLFWELWAPLSSSHLPSEGWTPYLPLPPLAPASLPPLGAGDRPWDLGTGGTSATSWAPQQKLSLTPPRLWRYPELQELVPGSQGSSPCISPSDPCRPEAQGHPTPVALGRSRKGE